MLHNPENEQANIEFEKYLKKNKNNEFAYEFFKKCEKHKPSKEIMNLLKMTFKTFKNEIPYYDVLKKGIKIFKKEYKKYKDKN
jgi:hypothetical protein